MLLGSRGYAINPLQATMKHDLLCAHGTACDMQIMRIVVKLNHAMRSILQALRETNKKKGGLVRDDSKKRKANSGKSDRCRI